MVRVVAALLLLAAAVAARAQEIEPRAYSNVPVGVNFLIVGYARSDGGLATDPSLALENADLRSDAMALAWARGIDVLGRSGKIDLLVPFGQVRGTAEYAGEPVERDISGAGDPRLRFSVNLYGAPALTVAELASWKQDLIVGWSVQVAAPLGQYDSSRLVNIGSNRWMARTELGLSQAIGRWTFELAGALTLFEDNDDFFGGRTREQDPVYSVQGGVVYGFPRGIWMALNGTYYTGGRTEVDGERRNDLQENSLAALTLALPLGRKDSLKLYASTGLATRIGSDADTLGVAWQHRWGGGL
jgi:hypothetical protein